MATKKKNKDDDKPKGLSALMESGAVAAIKKLYGKCYKVGDEAADLNRISSGILQLDKHLGGGWAVGYFHLLYGKESGGKTSTVLRTFAAAQKTCRNCYVLPFKKGECGCGDFQAHICGYIRLEEFDKTWASTLGVDLKELFLAEPYYEEEALDIAEALVLSGECDLIAIDSIAFMTPQKEIADSVAKDNPALQARQLGKGVRKLGAALTRVSREGSGRRPTFFFTNQIRFKVGVVFGSPETKPGGQAPNFAAGSTVRFGSTKYNHIEEGAGATKEKLPTHADFPYKIEKNKTQDARAEGVFRVMIANSESKHKGNTYDEHFIMAQLKRLEMIDGSGKDGKKPPYTFLGVKYPSGSAIEEALVKNRSLHFQVVEMLRQIWEKESEAVYSEVDTTLEESDPGLLVSSGE